MPKESCKKDSRTQKTFFSILTTKLQRASQRLTPQLLQIATMQYSSNLFLESIRERFGFSWFLPFQQTEDIAARTVFACCQCTKLKTWLTRAKHEQLRYWRNSCKVWYKQTSIKSPICSSEDWLIDHKMNYINLFLLCHLRRWLGHNYCYAHMRIYIFFSRQLTSYISYIMLLHC